jgi:tetratricopeptide (TPR) repeat protein
MSAAPPGPRPGPAPARGPAARSTVARAPGRPTPASATPAPPLAGPSMASPEMEDLARQINDGMSMLDHGRFDDAAELFRGILERSPNHLGALRGAVQASLRQNDLTAARGYAVRQGSALANQKAYDAMWEMLSELRKPIKDFNFAAKDQFMLARWLAEQNLPLEAAKTLRELGVAYPDDTLAPKALYQCADLLWKRCGKPEAAVQMLNYLLKRYPDAAFTDQVHAALTQIKAGK